MFSFGAYSALNWFFEALSAIAFVIEAWALGDALYRPAAAYQAAGKQTKPLWLVILGVAAVIGLAGVAYQLGPVNILVVAAFVAAAVYLTDVRPKVREFGRKSGPGSGTHMGPYGPW